MALNQVSYVVVKEVVILELHEGSAVEENNKYEIRISGLGRLGRCWIAISNARAAALRCAASSI
jgi:hypothetical protein